MLYLGRCSHLYVPLNFTRQKFSLRFRDKADTPFSDLVMIDTLVQNQGKGFELQHSGAKFCQLRFVRESPFLGNVVIEPHICLINCLPYQMGFEIISEKDHKTQSCDGSLAREEALQAHWVSCHARVYLKVKIAGFMQTEAIELFSPGKKENSLKKIKIKDYYQSVCYINVQSVVSSGAGGRRFYFWIKQFIANNTPLTLYYFTKSQQNSQFYNLVPGSKIAKFNEHEFTGESKSINILNTDVEL